MPSPSRPSQTEADLESNFSTPSPRRSGGSRRQPPPDVSPAETFDTALTSPMRTFDESDDDFATVPPPPRRRPSKSSGASSRRSQQSRAPPAQTVDINVKNAPQSRGAGLIFGLSKPFLIMALLFGAAGAAAGLGWFRIPGLKTQVKLLKEQVEELTKEIDRLSSEVDRLEEENDRYEDLNDKLNVTVVEIEEVALELNVTVQDLEEVATRLNITNADLVERIAELASENQEFERLNSELSDTVSSLKEDVQIFEDALADLIAENSALSSLTDSLESLVDNLSNQTIEQNETLAEMKIVLAEFVEENDRLENLNNGLTTVVEFLNSTALGLDASLEGLTQFLVDQIAANEVLVVENLESLYRNKVVRWDCNFRDVFRFEAWATDFTLPITNMEDVLIFVDDYVLSDLCLEIEDFESALTASYPEPVTANELDRFVTLYTSEALDYYFDGEEDGVTYRQWAVASFKCQNLPEKFSWDKHASGNLL